MPDNLKDVPVEVFSSCPASADFEGDDYAAEVVRIARWSEEAGCTGILIYTDNRLLDPWLVAQIVIQNTESLCPLVAVQPAYTHPYTVAKMVASIGDLYGRRVYLNMVAGGFKNDLVALGDDTPHDRRYERLIEYTTIVKELLADPSAVSREGDFYRVEGLKLTPSLPESLLPGIFVSGSSEAGHAAARQLGATAVKYPEPPDAARPELHPELEYGIRIGVIARPDDGRAWSEAHARFPGDRAGQLRHEMAMKVSDSVWHRKLSEMAASESVARSPYWLFPFENYKTFCPYLVGDYDRVAEELRRYLSTGFNTVILDEPPDADDLRHTVRAFETALVDEVAA